MIGSWFKQILYPPKISVLPALDFQTISLKKKTIYIFLYLLLASLKLTCFHITSRRGILLTDEVGSRYELVACEQRSATSWMEALNMMLGKGRGNKLGRVSGQNCWRYIFRYFNQLTIFVSFDSFLVEEIAIPMPTIRLHLKSNTSTLLPTLTISSVPARFRRKRIRRRLLVAFIIVSRRSTKRVMKLMTKRLKVSQSVVQLLRIHGISTV